MSAIWWREKILHMRHGGTVDWHTLLLLMSCHSIGWLEVMRWWLLQQHKKTVTTDLWE